MFRRHGTGEFAFGNQLARLAMHRNIPDMLGAPDMDGCAGGDDEPFACGPQMIGGDDRSDRVFFLRVHAHQRGKTADRFGQNAGRPAMQNTVNLVRALIDREARLDEIGADFQKFQPQNIEDIFRFHERAYLSQGIGFEPDHNAYANDFPGVRP